MNPVKVSRISTSIVSGVASEIGSDFYLFKKNDNNRNCNFISLSKDFRSFSMSPKSKKEIERILEMCEVVVAKQSRISVTAFIVLFAVYYRELVTSKEIRDYFTYKVLSGDHSAGNPLSRIYGYLSDCNLIKYEYYPEISNGGMGIIGRVND